MKVLAAVIVTWLSVSAVLSDARVTWEDNRRSVVVSWQAALEPGQAYEVCVWRVTPAHRFFMGCWETGSGLRWLRLPGGKPPYDAHEVPRPGDTIELVVSTVANDGERTEVGRTSTTVPEREWLTYVPVISVP